MEALGFYGGCFDGIVMEITMYYAADTGQVRRTFIAKIGAIPPICWTRRSFDK